MRPSSWKLLTRGAAPALGLLTAVLAPEVLAQSLSYSSNNAASDGWYIKISVNGGLEHTVQVDTGSLGLAVPLNRVGGHLQPARPEDLPQPPPPSDITYSSSHVTLVGQWVMAPVKFLPDGHATESMPVLGVVAKCEPGKPVKGKPDSRGPRLVSTAEMMKLSTAVKETDVCVEWSGGMMGVGFARGPQGTPPQYNALRQLSATLARTASGVRQGYIVHSKSIEVGLTEDNTRAFQWVQLSAVPGPSSQWPDWQALPGCFRLEHGKDVWKSDLGTVLVDTGLTNMYLSNPTLPPEPSNVFETSITVMSPCDAPPVLSQVFQRPGAPKKEGTLVPSRVDLFASPSFVNTGRYLIQKWDYAYDAQNGRVGFLRRR